MLIGRPRNIGRPVRPRARSAGREHQPAVAVGGCAVAQAVLLELGEHVVGDHDRPAVGVISSGIGAEMAESVLELGVRARAGRRHTWRHCRGPRPRGRRVQAADNIASETFDRPSCRISSMPRRSSGRGSSSRRARAGSALPVRVDARTPSACRNRRPSSRASATAPRRSPIRSRRRSSPSSAGSARRRCGAADGHIRGGRSDVAMLHQAFRRTLKTKAPTGTWVRCAVAQRHWRWRVHICHRAGGSRNRSGRSACRDRTFHRLSTSLSHVAVFHGRMSTSNMSSVSSRIPSRTWS